MRDEECYLGRHALNEYWMDITVGGQDLHVMVDTGLTDPSHQLGCMLEPTLFDQFRSRNRIHGHITVVMQVGPKQMHVDSD